MHEEEKIPEFMKRPKSNPFKTPDFYFETLEERIMAGIEQSQKKETRLSRSIRILKPIIGLAASFILVYLLVSYPLNNLLPDNLVKTEISNSDSLNETDSYDFFFLLVKENTLVNAITSEDETNSTALNNDEMLAYISVGMSDMEIYSEITK